MSVPNSVVIVGGGLAAAKAAEALREKSFAGPITIVGAEDHLPYERPPLSKGFLAGSADRSELDVHEEAWYADQGVTLRLGLRVTRIDRAEQQVELSDGSRLEYGALVLATGSTPRRIPLAGADAVNVLTLRKVEDSQQINAALIPGARVVIIGGGWIGMEIAANARERGAAVTIVEAAAKPLGTALGDELADVFLGLHTEHGVVFKLGAQVRAITTQDSHATGVDLADGEHLDADVIIIGVGAAPNVELAADAGLELDNGVLVDASLRTSDPAIFAVGDIANHDHPSLGRRVRVEHWANALNQPAAAAAAIVEQPEPYDELPYFYTDQYDLGMEYVGFAPPGSYSSVVTRGDLGGREFIAFWLDADNHVLAGMNVNVWDVVDDVTSLIRAGQHGTAVDPDRLADPSVPLAHLSR